MALTEEQKEQLANWQEIAKLAAHYKEQESQLRDKVVAMLADPSIDEGTEKVEIVPGWLVEIGKSLTYKLDNSEDKVLAVAAILDGDLAPKLIKWKPELSVSTYKQLDVETKALFNGCLEIKPAKPTLKIVEKKK